MAERRRPGQGLLGFAADKLEEATGRTLVEKGHLDLLEQSYIDYRAQTREIEDVGWSLFDYATGQPQELRRETRLRIVQQARRVWLNDPQAGASVELMNDFCFGRGVPAPRCKDKRVQEIVDDAWNDPDNQEVLTSLEAQLALGTDLALQSNFFVLMFDEGEDGKVKLSLLRHDDVTDAIADPERRHRILWYVCRRPLKGSFDFKTGTWTTEYTTTIDPKPLYYKHWRNFEMAQELAGDEDREDPVPEPPSEQVGDGKVYHGRINRYSEMKFGAPRFQRTLRWYTAYNDFVRARIDVAQASAAFIMKRKIRGTPQQVAQQAAKAMSRSSLLAQSPVDGAPMVPPRAGSIIEENDSVSHEALTLPSGAADAQADANIIRAPISASERFSQAYFGDASNSNLATATSLELPILKAVESRQEVFESLFRWFVDRVIERAVEKNLIPERLDKSEIEDYTVAPDELRQALQNAIDRETGLYRRVVAISRVEGRQLEEENDDEVWIIASIDPSNATHFRLVECFARPAHLDEAHEDAGADELSTNRDLSYEFSMPSPLRRMMTDLITSVQLIAQTFDPNNTNVELSRALLTIALGEGLEVSDPADLVERILPPGYVDPLLQAQMQAAQAPPVGPDGAPADGSQPFPTGPDSNAYSAPMNSTMPENGTGIYSTQEAVVVRLRDRFGQPLELTFRQPLVEAEMPNHGTEPQKIAARGAAEEAEEEFGRDVIDVALDQVDAARLGAAHPNGGNH